MRNYKSILLLGSVFIFLINFSFASNLSLYYENLRFQAFYRLAQLLPNPVSKISYLNALAETTLKTYDKLSKKQKPIYFRNYLIVLKELEKTWNSFSFSYSQYENFYKKSLELYVAHLVKIKKEIKNKQAEELLIKILRTVSLRLDKKAGVSFFENIIKESKLNLSELKTSEEEKLLQGVNFPELVKIMNEFKTLVHEFENGERIITCDYEEFEKKVIEIQNEIKKAQENIKAFKVEEFNQNIEKIKENLNFILKNSKKVK